MDRNAGVAGDKLNPSKSIRVQQFATARNAFCLARLERPKGRRDFELDHIPISSGNHGSSLSLAYTASQCGTCSRKKKEPQGSALRGTSCQRLASAVGRRQSLPIVDVYVLSGQSRDKSKSFSENLFCFFDPTVFDCNAINPHQLRGGGEQDHSSCGVGRSNRPTVLALVDWRFSAPISPLAKSSEVCRQPSSRRTVARFAIDVSY